MTNERFMSEAPERVGDDPRWTVIVPTRDRIDRLEACLRGLAAQRDRRTGAPPGFEILVAVDGPDAGEQALAARVLGGRAHRVLTGEPIGPAAARNRALAAARGELVLFLNDDVTPDASLLAEHDMARRSFGDDGRTIAVGAAPWKRRDDDSLFDRLVYETSTVFFYDTMDAAHDRTERDWGFRHAWTLNLSVAREFAQSVGGFAEGMQRPMYEDLEFGFRCCRAGASVRYVETARVEHDHRYTVAGLLTRDALLGHQAVSLARISSGCAAAAFDRDVLDAAEAERSLWFERVQRRTGLRSVRLLDRAAETPGANADSFTITALYEASLHARRVCWHAGHALALGGASADGAEAWAAGFVEQARSPRSDSVVAPIAPPSSPAPSEELGLRETIGAQP